MLDASVSVPHALRKQLAQQSGGRRSELEKADRLAHELVARRAATHDVAHAPVAHQQHLLLARGLLRGVEQEAVRMQRAHQPRQHRGRAEDVGVHDQHVAVERVTRRPQREDRPFAEARVGDTADGDAVDWTGECGAHLGIAETRHHDRVTHAGLREALQQPAQQARAADLDEALRPTAGRVQQALADAGGENDGGHRALPRTAPSALRKPSRSEGRSAPMLATRNASFANQPCPS